MKVKILYVGSILNKDWRGGEPIIARNLIEYLKRNNFDVYSTYYSPTLFRTKILKSLKGDLWSYRYRNDIDKNALKYYVKVIKEINPDIIIAQYDFDTTIIEAAMLTNKKIVEYVEIYWPICPKLTLLKDENLCLGYVNNNCHNCILNDYSGINKLALRLLLNDAHIKLKMENRIKRLNYDNVTIIVPNEQMKELFVKQGIRKEIINIIENGVNLKLFRYTEEKEKEKAICYFGGQNKAKGYNIFLKIAQRLNKELPNLKIYAAGTYDKKIISKFKFIDFVGYLDHNEVSFLLQKCKILVFPDIWKEPYGLIAVEAAAAGTVTVGSNIDNLSKIIENDVSGFIVEKGNVDAFVQKIKLLLDNKYLFKKMSNEAMNRALNFGNIDITHEKIKNLIFNILNEKNSISEFS